MEAFTQECRNLYRVTLAILEPCRTFICEPWKPSLGNFYSGTLWTRLLRNLYVHWNPANLYLGSFGAFLKTLTCKPCENQCRVTSGTLGTLGTFTRNCCGNQHGISSATLGALWNLYLGTLWEPLPWEPCWRPCTNLYSATFTWEPLLGNFMGTFTWAPWTPLFEKCWGLVGTFAWPPLLGSLRNLYLETLATFIWEPLLGNVGTCTV